MVHWEPLGGSGQLSLLTRKGSVLNSVQLPA